MSRGQPKRVTWGQLVEELKKTKSNDKLEIWMSSDPEGNEIRPLENVTIESVEEGGRDVLIMWPRHV